MPKQPTNYIGNVINDWTVISELKRNKGLDHNKIREKTRVFLIEHSCGNTRRVTYKNWARSIVKCNVCDVKEKTHEQKLKEYNNWCKPFMEGKNGKIIVNEIITSINSNTFKVLDVYYSREKIYPFKNLFYSVQCLSCDNIFETQYFPLSQKRFRCKCEGVVKGRPKQLYTNNKTIEETKTELEAIQIEIDLIFEQMLQLNKQNKLVDYVLTKYNFTMDELDNITL